MLAVSVAEKMAAKEKEKNIKLQAKEAEKAAKQKQKDAERAVKEAAKMAGKAAKLRDIARIAAEKEREKKIQEQTKEAEKAAKRMQKESERVARQAAKLAGKAAKLRENSAKALSGIKRSANGTNPPAKRGRTGPKLQSTTTDIVTSQITVHTPQDESDESDDEDEDKVCVGCGDVANQESLARPSSRMCVRCNRFYCGKPGCEHVQFDSSAPRLAGTCEKCKEYDCGFCEGCLTYDLCMCENPDCRKLVCGDCGGRRFSPGFWTVYAIPKRRSYGCDEDENSKNDRDRNNEDDEDAYCEFVCEECDPVPEGWCYETQKLKRNPATQKLEVDESEGGEALSD